MVKNIFMGSSFWALSQDDKATIRQFAEGQHPSDTLDVRFIYLNRAIFSEVVGDAEQQLDKIGFLSVGFCYLSDAQKDELEANLMLIYYQLSARYELDRIERRGYKLADKALQIKECARLINLLRLSRTAHRLDHSLAQELAISARHTQYLGIKLVVPALLEGVDAATSGRKKSLRDFISFINERRLYWVWGGASIAAVLSLLPSYVADTSAATDVLGWTGMIGGSLSWILYFMRAGLVWSGLIAHTFDFALTKEERSLGFTFEERWQTQWKMRKYRLLNDSIWGTCNLACFLVLVGSGLLGNLGNAFTAALLLMDAILTAYRMYEEETEHQANMLRYDKEVRGLEKQIQWTESMRRGDLDAIETLRLSLKDVKHKIFKAELNWKYKKQSTTMDLIYSTCLLAAFVVLCCASLFSPPLAVIVGVAGIVLCFALNLIYTSAAMTLSVSKSQQMQQVADQELTEQMGIFIMLAKKQDAISQDSTQKDEYILLDNQMKLVYLTLNELHAESRHQQKMISHQRCKAIVTIIRDAFIPPLFMASLVFMPLGVGVPLLIISLTLAIGLYWLLSKSQPQKAVALNEFPEASYRALCEKSLHEAPLELKASLDEGITSYLCAANVYN